jgi:hypothetical protein
MAKTLTELDQFDAAIVVPEGTDSRNQAAQDVERIAQRLANRTKWLNSHAGKLAANQQWTGTNIFTSLTRVEDQFTVKPDAPVNPALSAERSAGAGSGWQWAADFQTGEASSTQRASLYTMQGGGTIGGFAITYNARYVGGAAATQWTLIDVNQKATALIFRYGDVRLVTMNANSSPWEYWPQTTITGFGSKFMAEILAAARAQVTSNQDGLGNAIYGYQFSDPQTRWSPIPTGTLYGNVRLRADGSIERVSAISDPGQYDHIWIPIRVPPYCIFKRLNVHMFQLQSSQPDEFQLYRRIGTGAWTAIKKDLTAGANVETHSSYGEVTVPLRQQPSTSDVLVQSNEEYAYRWKVVSGDGASINNRIVGCEVEWIDLGPNNRIG